MGHECSAVRPVAVVRSKEASRETHWLSSLLYEGVQRVERAQGSPGVLSEKDLLILSGVGKVLDNDDSCIPQGIDGAELLEARNLFREENDDQ